MLHLADVVVAHHRVGGVDRAVTFARARRGTQFDHELVDALCRVAPDVFVELDGPSGWDEVISMEPTLRGTLGQASTDSSLEVLNRTGRADGAGGRGAWAAGGRRIEQQIASELGVAPKTAGSHVEHICTKLGVSTRAAAALFAIQHGLVPALPPLELR